MEFILEKGEEYILISEQSHLNELVNRINNGIFFAYKFKFSDRKLFISLLESIDISYKDFSDKYFYYNSFRKLHISESQFDYVWISTYGLIAQNKATDNRTVNSCLSQYLVISLLLKKATEVIEDERVYDIDSYSFSILTELTPAIFHNLTFYVEVFCKAYLSLTGTQAPHSHKLSLLYKKTVETMVNKNHNDSLFQILILDPLYKFVNHIESIPGEFKEHFIKYDDNASDDTVILFDSEGLNEMSALLELSIDFITDYFHIGTQTHYLESNIYQRMLDRADTEEKRRKLEELYPHLIKK